MSSSSAQPNVPGRGIVAAYGPRFWGIVVIIGVAAGVGGALLIELLHLVQHAAWSYDEGSFLHGVEQAGPGHRVVVLAIGGAFAGLAALALARVRGVGEVSEAIWRRGARMPLLGSIVRAVESIVIVALGASLGREAAPQQTGAAVASTLSERARLPEWQRRLLVACGAGAGMAAVYNVPLGGALFALEVLLGTLTLPLVLPALATSLIATAVAWIALGNRPTYSIPAHSVTTSQLVWALVVGPVAGMAAVLFVRLIARAHALRPRGSMRLIAPVLVFTGLGALAIAYPQLLGNGKNVVQLGLVAQLGVGLIAVLVVLKPLATAACLGSGAPGGLFTPTLAFGVLLGGLLGHAWAVIWPGAPQGSYAVIGGAAVLGAAMQGPLAAIVLVLELTHGADSLMVPILLAVVEATVLARVLGLPSIYSVRMGRATATERTPAPTDGGGEPAPAARDSGSRPAANGDPAATPAEANGDPGAMPAAEAGAEDAERHLRSPAALLPPETPAAGP